MNGQWIVSEIVSSIAIDLRVELDRVKDGFQGWAYLMPPMDQDHAIALKISTTDIGPIYGGGAPIILYNNKTGNPYSPAEAEEIWRRLPWITRKFEVRFDLSGGDLRMALRYDSQAVVLATLKRSRPPEPSALNARKMGWSAFIKYAQALESDRFVFRGQNSNRWRLRTTFHRTGRTDLCRYAEEDIPLLQRMLSSRTKHIYDISRPEQTGALLHLAQHHGYPTPLLDWTRSPYVAAFFAYSGIRDNRSTKPTDRVRVFIFDRERWCRNLNQLLMMNALRPHFSILEFIVSENDRAVPQQALSTVTNVDDIEAYVAARSQEYECDYLSAIDLPAKDHEHALRDLRMMGITRGSMFPGLDGICADLKDRRFPP